MELLFLFSSLFIGIQTFSCPSGSEPMPKEDVCMFLINQTVSYMNAFRRCLILGGIPAKVQNSFENAYLFAVAPNELGNNIYPYIGVERDADYTWNYADGSPLAYVNWAPNEPNNASAANSCTALNLQTGKWISSDCTLARPFICSINGDDFQCPNGWVYYDKTDSCYYLQNFTYADGTHWQTYTFTSAEAICQKMGSHLVSVHSEYENNFLSDLLTTDVLNAPVATPCNYLWAWNGLYGTGAVGSGTWTDGSPVNYSGHSPYSGGSTNWVMGNDRRCAKMGWLNRSSSSPTARFICKSPSQRSLRMMFKQHI
ncbi:unnamed protein product, partial [Mesorhabditis belari]|uniref:C-type lectin domain-containing protein n=1 Tax=Mesorhabditis belari TaxID=2138241 RepID=A0AAF3ERV1_9BILA